MCSEARSAYQEIQSGAVLLRLHAITWVLSAAADAFTWTLLIILAGERLPIGTHSKSAMQTSCGLNKLQQL